MKIDSLVWFIKNAILTIHTNFFTILFQTMFLALISRILSLNQKCLPTLWNKFGTFHPVSADTSFSFARRTGSRRPCVLFEQLFPTTSRYTELEISTKHCILRIHLDQRIKICCQIWFAYSGNSISTKY